MYENFCFAVNLVKHAKKKVDSCLNFQICDLTKGGFYSESAIRFSNLQKKILQKTILSLKFKFPANNSKQKIHISSSR